MGSSPIQVATYADLAHLVERHLAKVEVASSSLVTRSKKERHPFGCLSFLVTFGDLTCSGEMNSPCAKVLLRKTLVRRISAVPPCGSLGWTVMWVRLELDTSTKSVVSPRIFQSRRCGVPGKAELFWGAIASSSLVTRSKKEGHPKATPDKKTS